MSFPKNKHFFILSISLLGLLLIEIYSRKQSIVNYEQAETKIQQQIYRKEKIAGNFIREYAINNPHDLFKTDINPEYIKEEIFMQIYCNTELLYWSSNQLPASWKDLKNIKTFPATLKLKNGWYEVMKKNSKEHSYYAFILLKSEYAYQNNFLQNKFQSQFNIEKEFDNLITVFPNKLKYNIYSGDRSFLFSIVPINKSVEAESGLYSSWQLLLIFMMLVLIYQIYRALFSVVQNKNTAFFFFALAVCCIRFIMFEFRFPFYVYETPLFSPYYFASSNILPSLGDYLLNVLFTFYVIVIFIKERLQKLKLSQNLLQFSIPFIMGLMLLFLDFSVKNLIFNSQIPLQVNFIFTLNPFSFIAIALIGVIAASSLIIIYFLCERIEKDRSVNSIYTAYGIAVAILLLISLGKFNTPNLLTYAGLVIGIIISYDKSIRKRYPHLYFVIIAALSSFIISFYFVKYQTAKEDQNRVLLSEKLSQLQDPVAENLFSQVQNSLETDTVINELFKRTNKTKADLSQYLARKYFNGYWEKYNVIPSLFYINGERVEESQQTFNKKDISILELQIQQYAKPTIFSNLYFINNPELQTLYLAKLRVINTKNHSEQGTLYIEFTAKYISEEIGFPLLLLDKEVSNKELSNYSFAKYFKGNLTNHFGTYQYPLTNRDLITKYRKSGIYEDDEFSHCINIQDANTYTVITAVKPNIFVYLTYFSFISLFYSALLILVYLPFGIKYKFWKLNSFRSRIQFQISMVLVISFIFITYGTIVTIKKQYENQNIQTISEKIHSVLIDIEHLLGAEENLNKTSQEYLNYYLSKLANVIYTDINLYDLNGDLVASSRPKVFEQGLLSEKMNTEAYKKLHFEEKTEFIHQENVGKLNYLSAYIPFENNSNKLLFYINSPYFAKQTDLEKEISAFLTTIINIFLLLFILSITAIIILSNRITQPLKIMQQKIGSVQLGKRNELIEWGQDDEIGNLIREYNRMIVELANSTEALIKSEREGAWKEMAKQVAHEIKNPLTPMKLAVQHLQVAFKNQSEDRDIRFDKTAKMLIEQIDTLSSIASEFANFAKMPVPKFETINIVDVIDQVVDLFKAETTSITVQSASNNILISNDKDYLIRTFNNIIKNGLQAARENTINEIKITIEQTGQAVLISINDNGKGMNEEVKEKIFQPNFTTKTTGAGLGLAMVKNMVEISGGKIWFESSEDSGTTFYIKYPTV